MLTTLATLAALALMQQTDTTVPVRAGARLEVHNFGGEIAVKTWNRNAVRVLGGSGNVSLKSVMGAVTLEKARGRIDLSSVNEEIRATEVSGDITAETVNGDITLIQIESANAEANTVNGDITYDGTIKDGGRYRFGTHDGDVRVSVPEKANVSVSVSTFNGDFSACFPVQLTGKTKHRFNFTIGSGSARLELESFGGDIKICRQGQLLKDKDRDKDKDEDHEED